MTASITMETDERRRIASRLVALAALAAGVSVVACSDGGSPVSPDDMLPEAEAGLELVATGLEGVTAVADLGDGVLVAEAGGAVRIVRDGVASTVLDLSDSLYTGFGLGLLDLAVHPDFPADRRVFLSYLKHNGVIRAVWFRLAASLDTVEHGSGGTVIEASLAEPAAVGGGLAFGPDGMLYFGIGDGGAAEEGIAREPTLLPGSLLRLDVDGGSPYAIPTDNPYADGADGRPEVWAKGLQEPRSVVFAGGWLYLTDRGGPWQEVNVQEASLGGLDYGWPIRGGSHCVQGGTTCASEGLVPPAYEYGPNPNLMPIGGVVYHGDAIPELRGQYVFSDFWAGWVRSFTYAAGDVEAATDWALSVRPARWTGYALDIHGEVLVFGGQAVYRWVPPSRD